LVDLIAGIDPGRVRENLARIEAEIATAAVRRPPAPGGGERRPVEVLAATKYVSLQDMPLLAQGGVRLVGENRAQDLQAKAQAHGRLFEWDFIGQLQSRRVRLIVPLVEMIHSVASESAMRELERHREQARPGLKIMVEVDLAGEATKAGVPPEELDRLIALSPFPVAGLMTMPPSSGDPESSRGWFSALRELADERGLDHLSMGTSQDYRVAVEEGATIVRLGTSLYS
jgi:PLP dependent protein